MNVKLLIKSMKSVPTRERATSVVKRYLSKNGWFIVDKNDNFDILATKSTGSRVLSYKVLN